MPRRHRLRALPPRRHDHVAQLARPRRQPRRGELPRLRCARTLEALRLLELVHPLHQAMDERR